MGLFSVFISKVLNYELCFGSNLPACFKSEMIDFQNPVIEQCLGEGWNWFLFRDCNELKIKLCCEVCKIIIQLGVFLFFYIYIFTTLHNYRFSTSLIICFLHFCPYSFRRHGNSIPPPCTHFPSAAFLSSPEIVPEISVITPSIK